MNTNYITVKTSMGYISAEENKGKIYSIKFLKRKIKKTNNKILLDFKKNLFIQNGLLSKNISFTKNWKID